MLGQEAAETETPRPAGLPIGFGVARFHPPERILVPVPDDEEDALVLLLD